MHTKRDPQALKHNGDASGWKTDLADSLRTDRLRSCIGTPKQQKSIGGILERCGNSPPCISDRDSHAIVPSGEFTSPWTPHARAKSTCMGAARSRNDGNDTLQNNVVRK
ncbi:hypothetical protein ALC60_06399 [Trachymyrmex zeteki]|uniref:Uncharacterized protein n=1 Tax=Mycetomoellerius zeteki TaxID=64791 RepID=A0A151X2Y0_9HYME|nr:hypothetical protein ALC60_06399 [Trachymyrmex zeteki]